MHAQGADGVEHRKDHHSDVGENAHPHIGEAEGDEQQNKWNECFDIIADNAVLYPVVHVKTVSASWNDPSTAPNGEALDGFKGIGTTSMSFKGVATVKA